MISGKRIPIVVTSDTAANQYSRPIHVDSNPLTFHVLVAAAQLVGLEGSLDGTNWVDMNDDNVAGAYTLTAIATVGAGYHRVHERPKYVRMVVDTDAGGPRDFYAVLTVRTDLN